MNFKFRILEMNKNSSNDDYLHYYKKMIDTNPESFIKFDKFLKNNLDLILHYLKHNAFYLDEVEK